MAIELERAVLLASGAAMLALAAAILAAGPGRGIHRAFAALVAAKGFAVLLPQASTDPGWVWAAVSVQPYFALAVVPIALYCLHALSSAAAPARRRAGWTAVAGVAALDLAYWADHGLFHGLARGEAATGALRAADGVAYTSTGPLAAVAAAAAPLLALLALRLAVRYRLDPAAPGAHARLLLCGGLLAGALFDGANRLAALAALLDQPQGYPWLPWGWADAALPATALLPALLAAAVLAGGRAQRRPAHALEGRLLLLGAAAFASGFLRLALPSDSDPAGSALVLVLLGLWRLAMPALAAAALLRGRGPAAPAPDGRPIAPVPLSPAGEVR